MNLISHYVNCLKQYSDFSGRTSRLEFWSFILANFLINIVLRIAWGVESKIVAIYGVLMIIPILSAIVRRLHDVGHSGKILFLMLIPFFLSFKIFYGEPSRLEERLLPIICVLFYLLL